MALIPDSAIRQEAWDGEMHQLREHLDSIPFTTNQRRTIDYRLDRLTSEFNKAQAVAEQHESKE